MRHLKHRHKLGVKTAHRGALLANLTASLILHKRIQTTLAKAKALRPFAEQVITLAKKAHAAEDPARKLHYRRLAVSKVRDQEAVALLFSERVEEFLNRPGGYTRIYKLVPRQGDAANVAIIELIDADDEGYTKPKKTRKRSRRSSKKAEASAEESTKEEAPAAESAEAPATEATAEESAEATSEESGSEKK
ncbi:50S ribosomal protein L17 [Puniceicoccus vermicola]|uniref:Large ribosomal subunit protein bL17 n=1 Tax=Puniceicoccus vermicola TaxID=388746 RepID=A0A7X1B0C8_9BACT|nr:50S ribosomal protein L17 [Puniceicoccus vermicola]MBC2603301.1 50S ribosomal protein L17 [Puniceicoccus vermicola]